MLVKHFIKKIYVYKLFVLLYNNYNYLLCRGAYMTTIIIGAGASGLACAIRLKQNIPTDEVIVLERLDKVGKKILATGNGRCNLTNLNADNSDMVLSFFSDLGLVTKADDEGRVYPYSNQATTVLNTLLDACERLGVEIITDCTVESIDRDMCISTTQGIFMADNIVIATGGMAQNNLGSNGSGYDLLKSLGHNITPLYPALVQLTSSSKYPRALKGHRVKCNMSILLDNEVIDCEYGEVLFADYGLSGIVTMDLSHIVSKNFALNNPKKCHAILDLIPDMSENELTDYINKYKSLNGILGSQLANIINTQANGDLEKTVKFAKSWKLIITGTKGYDFAQITGGGARLDEFKNYESKLANNIFACGEILDFQYKCGGYNLNHAWYSGIKVADRIANI